MNQVIAKRPYQHFKGNMYYVHDILEDTETGESIVSYQALYPPYGMYARALDMFVEDVEMSRADNVTGQTTRFQLYEGG